MEQDKFKKLYGQIEKLIKSARQNNFEDYEKASWPYLRADKDGQVRALTKVLHLLTKEYINDN